MSKALELTNANINDVLNTDKLVLVDFHAAWCGPCRMMSQVIDQLAEDVGDSAIVTKLDVDNNQDVASKYGVRNIPAILIFKNGEVIHRTVGVQPISTLSALLK